MCMKTISVIQRQNPTGSIALALSVSVSISVSIYSVLSHDRQVIQ